LKTNVRYTSARAYPLWRIHNTPYSVRHRRGLFAIAWLIFSPETFGWAAVATLATWIMTLFINRTGYRDTQALHAKLDELLRTHGEARTELTALDDSDVEDIEKHRRQQRERDAPTKREKPWRAF
jgi:low affinity Fe/Cu permease